MIQKFGRQRSIVAEVERERLGNYYTMMTDTM